MGFWNGMVGRSLRASAAVAVLFRPALVRVAESFGASSGGTTPSPGSYFSHLLLRYAWRIVLGLGLFTVLTIVVIQSNTTSHPGTPTLGASPPPTSAPPPEVYIAGLRQTIDGLGLRPVERAARDRTVRPAGPGATGTTLAELHDADRCRCTRAAKRPTAAQGLDPA